MMKYAEVAVDAPVAPSRTFSYHIPPTFQLQPGQLVWVPFGRQTLQGLVIELAAEPKVEVTKDILQPVEPAPLLDAIDLSLAQWISRYYFSPLFAAAALFLPPGFKAQAHSQILPLSTDAADLDRLKPATQAALQSLLERRRLSQREFAKLLGKSGQGEVNRLVKRGIVHRRVTLPRPRSFRYAAQLISAAAPTDVLGPKPMLEPVAKSTPKLTPRQAELLRAVGERGEVYSVAQANKKFGPGSGEALVEKGLLALEWERQDFSVSAVSEDLEEPGAASEPANSLTPPPLTLTPAQEAALSPILAALENPELRPPAFLLHGVTGGGKTEVYLRAIQRVVEQGKQAIFLVPEIALTPQTAQRVNDRFPGRVALLHSHLTDAQKFDQWWKIRDGAYDVVVGPRSALFAPAPNLGIIVIDEEHEWTYKQEDTQPFYHARTAALELARLTGALAVLGSATPDVESYHQARRGYYRLLELPQRIRQGRSGGANPLAGPSTGPVADPLIADPITSATTSSDASGLAQVEICDMRLELRQGNRSIFSRSLSQALTQCIERDQQAILFLNRRGSAPIVQCRDCGYVVLCSGCALPLTYHNVDDRLRCHRCNRRRPPPRRCRRCDSGHIRQLGLGVQRVVDQVKSLLPQVQVERWDADAARESAGPAEIFDRLAQGRTQVLVGTQMVAKGLDVPNVTLVGAVLADVGLYRPDFRAGERSFGLLCQVAGRAGRGAEPGRAIIQTYNPEHYAVAAAANQDYSALFRTEIQTRQQQGNPPFARLIQLLYRHFNPTICQQQATADARLLRERINAQGLTDVQVIGPAPGNPERVGGRYLWRIILRGRNLHRFLERIVLPSRDLVIDVDPLHLL